MPELEAAEKSLDLYAHLGITSYPASSRLGHLCKWWLASSLHEYFFDGHDCTYQCLGVSDKTWPVGLDGPASFVRQPMLKRPQRSQRSILTNPGKRTNARRAIKIVQTPCNVRNNFERRAPSKSTYINNECPSPASPTKCAVQICGKCTLHGTWQHCSDRLCYIVKTHPQSHFVW